MSRLGVRLAYLDRDRMEAVEATAFQRQQPYPWIGLEGLVTAEGYQRLRETLPDVRQFAPYFRVQRAHGQRSHDRFTLEYRPDLDVPAPWHEFVRELRASVYRRFIRRVTGHRGTQLSFHWHYTPNGCSVSPHCDNRSKIGSHIFYFNTADSWDPAWGGETLILDDGGRFDRRSAPDFDDFDRIISAPALGNRSLLFARRHNSWHGVREIRCPEGAYRKVFIVVINDWTTRVRGWLPGRRRAGAY